MNHTSSERKVGDIFLLAVASAIGLGYEPQQREFSVNFWHVYSIYALDSTKSMHSQSTRISGFKFSFEIVYFMAASATSCLLLASAEFPSHSSALSSAAM